MFYEYLKHYVTHYVTLSREMFIETFNAFSLFLST